MAKRRYRKRKNSQNGTFTVMALGFLGLVYSRYKEYIDKINSNHIATIVILIACIAIFYIVVKLLFLSYKKAKYLSSDISAIDTMKGVEFEEYLKLMFEKKGYRVELTPKTADYGVDLVCKKKNEETGEKEEIVIQAKRYRDKIGIKAVQELIGGMHYYDCPNGMVITNSLFTDNARRLAEKSNVVLWDRYALKKEIAKLQRQQES